MPRLPDPRAGFTLVEVLAALLVTAALVSVVLPYAGRLIERWRTGQASLESADAWMQVTGRLRNDVAQALPIEVSSNGATNLQFYGDETRLTLVRPALGAGSGSGLERVDYAVSRSAASDDLIRKAAPYRAAAGDQSNEGHGTSATLVHGPYRFRFAFVGSDGRQRPAWVERDEMPVRVELKVSTPDGHPLPFSPLVLPLVARSSAARLLSQPDQRGPPAKSQSAQGD